jgi:hypothetical protein
VLRRSATTSSLLGDGGPCSVPGIIGGHNIYSTRVEDQVAWSRLYVAAYAGLSWELVRVACSQNKRE